MTVGVATTPPCERDLAYENVPVNVACSPFANTT